MKLSKPDFFFDRLRYSLFQPNFTQSEVDGINAILTATEAWSKAFTAYGLATAYHETAHSMQPISEFGGNNYFFRMYDPKGNRPQVAARLGNIQPGDGVRFHGRGYVQLTGRKNYTEADALLELGGALVINPDLALQPATAAEILVSGMEKGWFTGHSLAEYLPTILDAFDVQFANAREVVNGQDCAAQIAQYALEFQNALTMGA